MPINKYASLASLGVLAWLCLAKAAPAVAPPANAEETVVANQTFGRARVEDGTVKVTGFLSSALHDINRTFEIPVSYEWPYIEADRSSLKQPDISLSIGSDQTLAETLDLFVNDTGGALRWGRVQGVLCVRPPDSATHVENSLDIVVSLKLESASTWEAFIALAQVINSKPIGGRRLVISPHFLSTGMAAPPLFRDDNSITLDLQDVSARDAACVIMAMSPLELSYRYSNHHEPTRYPNSQPTASLWIQVYMDGVRYYTHDTMPTAELVQYMEEHHVMRGDSITP